MSKYLCLECFDVYNAEYLNPKHTDAYSGVCPKSDCNGELICVDELMLPAIKLLNKKGYFTDFCCSGHCPGDNSMAYIMFSEGVDVQTLPKGFHFDNKYNNVVIRSDKGHIGDIGINDLKIICENAVNLTEWAKNLPFNEYY